MKVKVTSKYEKLITEKNHLMYYTVSYYDTTMSDKHTQVNIQVETFITSP
jgi:hypothetical protein